MEHPDMNEQELEENNEEVEESSILKDNISGFGQFIIGEIETIGGVLTADPTTQAEGEFNVEVGTVREEIEEDLEEGDDNNNQ